MGDIGENYDPPIYPTYGERARITRRPRQTAPGATPREEALRRAIARDQAELAELEAQREKLAARFGSEPPSGTVITFARRHHGSGPYSYAALRAAGAWYLTGRETTSRTWERLCEFIGDAPFRVILPDDSQVVVMSTPEANSRDGGAFEALLRGVSGKGKAAMADSLLRSARKLGIAMFVDESGALTKVPQKGEPQTATDRALAKAFRYVVGREPNQGRWQVWDEMASADFAGAREIVKTFPANEKGERRARQSVADRNAAYRAAMRHLEAEPPVGSRVTSTEDPEVWARRDSNGWIRYRGAHIQSVGLRWESVCHVLGTMRPGSPGSPELIDETAE